MRYTGLVSLLLGPIGLATAGAQTVGQRVTASDGVVQVIYPSRPGACGDGSSYIGNVLGRDRMRTGDAVMSGQVGWTNRPCVRGPARVVATVLDGEITRLHAYVGPAPTSDAATRTLTIGAAEASVWLGELVMRGSQRTATQAMLPLLLADASEPWPLLIKVARETNRAREVRQSALMWLSNGIAEHLGISDASDADTDDDQMRAQAVYALTQRPKSESVPALIDLARTATHPAARKAAIYWLGQSGDARAVDVYAELLGLR
ncbi:MAG: HEAT repeat domain-containing protein [bacterium]